jgi:hypothetical protein
VAAFLRRDESAARLSRAEFRQLMEDTLTHLERQQEEA